MPFGLSIVTDDEDESFAAEVIASLMYIRDTVSELHYNVRTMPHMNILEKCGWKKLEALTLCHNTILGVEPMYQKFLCPKYLSLSYVCVDSWDPSLLLTAFPRVEELTLISLDIVISDPQATMELATNSLRYILPGRYDLG